MNSLIVKVEKLFEQRQYDYALSLLKDAWKAYPEDIEVMHWMHLASIHVRKVKNVSFLSSLLKSCVYVPLFLRAGWLLLADRHVSAQLAFERLLLSFPESYRIYGVLVDLAEKRHLHQRQVLLLEEMSLLWSKDPSVLKRLARTYVKSGQTRKAREVYAELKNCGLMDQEAEGEMKNLEAIEMMDAFKEK